MIKIEQIGGQDKRLYELVAPLIMNPRILRQNNNYPFKTTRNHIWLVALENEQVLGFLPVEKREGKAVINNYYVREESLDLLVRLIQQAVLHLSGYEWAAVSQTSHRPAFIKCGFREGTVWKKYIKMIR